MKSEKYYYVYITSNKTNTTLYTGVTSDLINRINKHKRKLIKGFTARYNVNKLVCFEEYHDVNDALNREKQIKSGSRQKKIQLIEKSNPDWKDLFDDLI